MWWTPPSLKHDTTIYIYIYIMYVYNYIHIYIYIYIYMFLLPLAPLAHAAAAGAPPRVARPGAARSRGRLRDRASRNSLFLLLSSPLPIASYVILSARIIIYCMRQLGPLFGPTPSFPALSSTWHAALPQWRWIGSHPAPGPFHPTPQRDAALTGGPVALPSWIITSCYTDTQCNK